MSSATRGRPGPRSSRSTQEAARRAAEQAAQRRRDRRRLALLVVVLVLALVGGGLGLQAWRTGRNPVAAPPGSYADAPQRLAEGQPIRFGNASAPVELTVYEDFHCPHCADFEEAYQGVLDQALRANQVSIRFSPLAFVDAGSASAANGFGCAVQAGYGESYFRGLFANHTLDWSDDQLISLMERVSGAPASAAFSTCVQQRQSGPWLESINAAASQRGVNQTPTMFLDGAPVDIATLTPDALRTKIEQAAS